MYVYVRSESNLWTVGFYDPKGQWHADSDHAEQEMAARRAHWLNGGGITFEDIVNMHVEMEDKILRRNRVAVRAEE